jgi:small subunit ribosomal protein S2
MKETDLKDLMKAGIHFGHKGSIRHPRMKKYLYGAKNGVDAIDISQTAQKLKEAAEYLTETVARGGEVLFVGTKPQARVIIEKYAKEAGVSFVTERWLGGTLTNHKEIFGLVKKLENRISDSKKTDYETKYTKKERLVFSEEMVKLEKNIGGIVDMRKIPSVIFIASVRNEKTPMKEAILKNVPIVGVCDSNANPDNIKKIIPANDDAIKSIELVVSQMAEAVKQGRAEYEAYQADMETKKVADAKQKEIKEKVAEIKKAKKEEEEKKEDK